MNILHLLSQIELTGAEVYAQNLIKYQVEQGHQVQVISDKMHVPIVAPLISLPISTSSFFVRLSNMWKLRKFMNVNKIDVIHCHSRAASRHAYWASLGTSTAQIFTAHGIQHASFSKKIKDIYGQIIISICENAKTYLVDAFGTNKEKIHTVRNPFNLTDYPFQFVQNKKVALIGRSSGPKGQRIVEIVKNCADELLRHDSQLQIDIITPQPELLGFDFIEKIKSLQSNFDGRIKIISGHISSFSQTYPNYSLVVGAGRVAGEAALCGCSVLALGEASYEGPLTPANFSQVIQSNFGDIAIVKESQKLEASKFILDLAECLKNRNLSTQIKIRELVAQDFGEALVNQRLIDFYKAAIFKKRIKNIPVLMYHKIPIQEIETKHRIFVTRENFEKHLQFFVKSGFQSLFFSEVKEFWDLKKDYSLFPKKPLLLTFDDGYVDNLENAVPLLKKYGFKATQFLLSDNQILHNTWDTSDASESAHPIMNLEQRKQLVQSGAFEIGSHGATHRDLRTLSDEEALAEMIQSKKDLEKYLNVAVCSIAYPFGYYNERTAQLAQEAGYTFAVATDNGGLHFAENPYAIFRVNIFPQESTSSLWKKTLSLYRRYFYFKRRH